MDVRRGPQNIHLLQWLPSCKIPLFIQCLQMHENPNLVDAIIYKVKATILKLHERIDVLPLKIISFPSFLLL